MTFWETLIISLFSCVHIMKCGVGTPELSKTDIHSNNSHLTSVIYTTE